MQKYWCFYLQNIIFFISFECWQMKVERKLLYCLKYFLMWCISLSCVTFLVILAQQSYSWFMQTVPDSMLLFFSFLLSSLRLCFPTRIKKHKTLQPGKFHMSQVKASAVQQKGWLSSSPQEKHEVSPCQPGCVWGWMKMAFFCAYSQVWICFSNSHLCQHHSALNPK